MGTNYIAPIWRMPRNANKDKLSNYSIDFSAAGNEYITVASSSELDNVPLGLYSISFWLKFTSVANMVISEKRASNSFVNAQFTVHLGGTGHAGELSWYGGAGGGTPIFSSSTLNDGNWHHIALVAESTSVSKMYIDGQLDVTSSTNRISSAAVAGTFRIGSNYSGSYRFHGQLSQYCIFDYALDLNQVDYLYNLNNPMAITGAEPVAYWPLGDNSNPNANAGYPNISVGADSVFDFNGATGVIPLPQGSLQLVTSISISAWIKTTTTGTRQTIISNDNVSSSNKSSGRCWNFLVNGQNLDFTVREENGATADGPYSQVLSSGVNVSDNNWHHVVGVWDGTTNTNSQKVFVDGILRAQGTPSFTQPIRQKDTNKPTIGDQAGQTQFWDFEGEMSNIQVWESALTYGTVSSLGDKAGGEVAQLYNNGQPLMTGTQPQVANLKAWYKLDQSANWEADTAGDWQIPDAVSSYPQSFDFDGTTDCLFSFSPITLNTTEAYTISAWVNLDTTSNQTIVSGNASGGTDHFTVPFAIKSVSGSFAAICSFQENSSSISRQGNNIAKNELTNGWHHVMLVKDGVNCTFYYDGQPNGTSSFNTTPPATINLTTIGKGFNNFMLNGRLSNLQVWQAGLTATDAQTLYNNGVPLTTAIATNNLKGWWKLNNTELFDGNNWSISNQKYPANYTSALYFTGGVGNEHLDTPSNSDLLMAGSHTFSLWLYVNSSQTDPTNYIFDKGGLDYSLGFSANALRLIYYNYYDSGGASGNNKIVVLDSDWKTTYQNGWHHIFVSVDQPNLTVTLITDGTDISTHALPADYVSPDQGAGALNIMSYNGATLSLAGFISNLAFFNGTALTNSQALTLYNNGTPENSISFSPTSWWKINNTSTGLLDNAGTSNLINTGGVEKNIFVSSEAATSSGMTEQNLVNNNVSALNGESVGMNTTNLVQSNLTRKQPFSNYSIHFDSLDYFEDSGGGFLNGATTFTISAWARFDALGSNPVINAWGTDRQYLLRHVNNSSDGFQFYVGGNFNTGSPATFILAETGVSIPVAVDTWYNIVGTFDGTTANIYVNGVLGGSGSTTSGTLNSTASPNQIGRFSSTYMDGYISNAAYWIDVVLNQDDILNIYNNGVSQDLNNFRIKPTNWVPLDQSHTYYNGSVIVARDAIGGGELDGQNLIQENIAGKAPGSEANGTGNNLTIADLKGNMSNSDKNAYSINMGDYADGITNPANSGRSTSVP